MKAKIVLVLLAGTIFSCQEKGLVEDEFTGNEITYQLQQASDYDVQGAVTFKERRDGGTSIEVQLTGTEGKSQFPVHLHFGNIYTPDAEIASNLTPVLGETGHSSTLLQYLGGETKISYQELIQMDAHIKIHLAAYGYDSQVILVAGNVGSNGIEISKETLSGRVDIPVCRSN